MGLVGSIIGVGYDDVGNAGVIGVLRVEVGDDVWW